jgi:hypothetical protein
MKSNTHGRNRQLIPSPHRRGGDGHGLGCLWRVGRDRKRSSQAWLAHLWPEAQALGVVCATFEAATRALEPELTLPDVVVIAGRPGTAAREQPEFVQPPAVEWFEGNFADYEEDKKRRLGVDSTIPTRIKYKKFAR